MSSVSLRTYMPTYRGRSTFNVHCHFKVSASAGLVSARKVNCRDDDISTENSSLFADIFYVLLTHIPLTFLGNVHFGLYFTHSTPRFGFLGIYLYFTE
jgi:hypothetical protein